MTDAIRVDNISSPRMPFILVVQCTKPLRSESEVNNVNRDPTTLYGKYILVRRYTIGMHAKLGQNTQSFQYTSREK